MNITKIVFAHYFVLTFCILFAYNLNTVWILLFLLFEYDLNIIWIIFEYYLDRYFSSSGVSEGYPSWAARTRAVLGRLHEAEVSSRVHGSAIFNVCLSRGNGIILSLVGPRWSHSWSCLVHLLCCFTIGFWIAFWMASRDLLRRSEWGRVNWDILTERPSDANFSSKFNYTWHQSGWFLAAVGARSWEKRIPLENCT